GMIRRPKPTDSEADLLEEQERFLASGTPSTVNVVRRPDKRSGDTNGAQGDQRDVVTIQDLPDELPTLTPAPPKKSRLKVDRVRFEDEDPEERLDRHDTHISAVLSKIIERDTSTTPVSLPAFTGLAFPKVLHRPEMESMVPAAGEKRSIFARQIAAQRIKEGNTPLYFLGKLAHVSFFLPGFSAMAGPRLVSGQGLGGSDSTVEMLKIHQENQAKLQAMSNGEILEEQKRLLGQLGRHMLLFEDCVLCLPMKCFTNSAKYRTNDALPPCISPEEDLPVKPQKEWVHMDKLEPEKLEWIRDLPAPRRKGTKQAMLARFDFAGTLIPPTEDLPTHLGLHHHGEEPELAGYSLQELFLLSRSQVIQQRRLALNTLAHVLTKARAGEFAAALRGSVVSTLLDAGLLFLLRFSLDDNVEGVVSAAVHALRALLVSSDDEDCLDSTLSWFRGLASFPLLPTAQEEEDEEDEGLPEVMRETAQEKEEKKTDHDVARNDVVKGLLRMKLLPRLRYILEVIRPSPRVVQDVLGVLIRIARHSSSAVLDCPRLMETVMSEFLPCSWTVPASPTLQSTYGLPVANAMKLLRVLATTGRHACARLLNSLGARERLSRLLAPEPSELLLEPEEALRVSIEAYRLWAVAASYGQDDTLGVCRLSVVIYLCRVPRCSSAVCNPQSCCPAPETIPSLPGLHCAGWTSAGGLPGPNSPFPLITSLCYLLDTLTSIHRGLAVLGYLRGCGQAKPTLSHWVLRHEHHLLYLLLRLACRLVPTDPEVAKHAALFHHVSLVMLPWLLPGSEYLAHELMATMVFNKDFIPEGQIGGPEAAEMSELRVQERSSPPLQTLGPLLREACVQLPSVRGCYLSHLAHMEPSVLSSRDFHLGRTPWLNTQLLPELSGPFLPSDWPFLPLVSLYERAGAPDGGGLQVESLPAGAVQSVTHCLQWLLLLEVWREDALRVVLPVAKLARLACIFLCSSDLFMEMPVQRLTWALFRLLTRPSQLEALDLNSPPTGLASFNDLYSALVGQFEAVSFGDPLFGCVILLPLQRRFSVTMRLTLFGEHVGLLRSLGVTLEQLAVPMERFTSPPEDSLPLLRLYFRALVTGTLRLCWCPVLYVVALSHLNTFIFSQDAASQQVETARRSLLRKTHYLTDEVLRSHLLLFRLPQKDAELGFNTYDQLPPIRQRRLESVLGTQGTSDSKGE
uniref:RNA polymerase II associated protein 1 n=1 Tax=Oncorhynchus mykiss TaxID=8022 RepID=A0A8C7SXU9_ONCMY